MHRAAQIQTAAQTETSLIFFVAPAGDAELGAGEQDQARCVSPEEQAYRYIERTVERVKIEVGQHQNEQQLGQKPYDSSHYRCAQDGAPGDFAVGQDPVNSKEEEDRCYSSGQSEPSFTYSFVKEVIDVMKEENSEQRLRPGI